MHTMELHSAVWAVWCTPKSFLKIKISQQNRIRSQKYFSLIIRGLDGFESWQKWRTKISWHTPFKMFSVLLDSGLCDRGLKLFVISQFLTILLGNRIVKPSLSAVQKCTNERMPLFFDKPRQQNYVEWNHTIMMKETEKSWHCTQKSSPNYPIQINLFHITWSVKWFSITRHT